MFVMGFPSSMRNKQPTKTESLFLIFNFFFVISSGEVILNSNLSCSRWPGDCFFFFFFKWRSGTCEPKIKQRCVDCRFGHLIEFSCPTTTGAHPRGNVWSFCWQLRHPAFLRIGCCWFGDGNRGDKNFLWWQHSSSRLWHEIAQVGGCVGISFLLILYCWIFFVYHILARNSGSAQELRNESQAAISLSLLSLNQPRTDGPRIHREGPGVLTRQSISVIITAILQLPSTKKKTKEIFSVHSPAPVQAEFFFFFWRPFAQ